MLSLRQRTPANRLCATWPIHDNVFACAHAVAFVSQTATSRGHVARCPMDFSKVSSGWRQSHCSFGSRRLRQRGLKLEARAVSDQTFFAIHVIKTSNCAKNCCLRAPCFCNPSRPCRSVHCICSKSTVEAVQRLISSRSLSQGAKAMTNRNVACQYTEIASSPPYHSLIIDGA